jgi:hypothetical protein
MKWTQLERLFFVCEGPSASRRPAPFDFSRPKGLPAALSLAGRFAHVQGVAGETDVGTAGGVGPSWATWRQRHQG